MSVTETAAAATGRYQGFTSESSRAANARRDAMLRAAREARLAKFASAAPAAPRRMTPEEAALVLRYAGA